MQVGIKLVFEFFEVVVIIVGKERRYDVLDSVV